MDFTHLQAKRCNAESANFVKVQTPQAGTYLFLRRQCGTHRTPARGIESTSGDIHEEDSYYQTVLGIDGKIVMLVTDDVTFYGMPP